MKVSKMLLLSLFITAALVAVVGGVVTKVIAEKSSAASSDSAAAQQREAQYQQTILEANQQLEQANQQLKAMQQQLTQKSEPTASLAVSVDQAAKIAQEAAETGQRLKKQPELVKYEDKVAYEVVFEKGSIYVDASNGDVLFNGTVPQTITAEKAGQVAEAYLKEKGVLSVDQITFRGAPLFRVVLASGMMVYMDLTGQITYIQKAVRNTQVMASSSGSGSSAVVPTTPPPSQPGEPHETEDD